MKKVLIITYYWPPSGGAGVQRWLKFSKFLPEFGWEPIILTVDPTSAEYPQIDKSLSSDIDKNISVFRTKATNYYSLYKKATKTKQTPYGGFSNEGEPSLIQKTFRFIRGNLFIPDPRIGWNKFAIKKAIKIIDTENPSLIITTGPPHSTHLIGDKIKKKKNIKWIADFRDPWTDIYYNDLLLQTSFVKAINKEQEIRVLRNCDHLLTASNGFKKLFKKKLNIRDDKIQVIYNGFDNDDIKDYKKKNDNTFTITHTGTLSESYNLTGFIIAIQNIRKQIDKKLIIRFVGNVSKSIINLFEKYGINDVVELIDYVPHSKSIEYIFNSDVLLLAIPDVKNNEGIVPGKLFEYISTKNQILALGPISGDVETILKQTNCGKVINPNNIEEIEGLILSYYQNTNIQVGNIDRFSRKEQTKILMKLFDFWGENSL